MNFQAIRRFHNYFPNQLASKATNYGTIVHSKPIKEVKLVFILFMPDNDYHWKIFDSNDQINQFIQHSIYSLDEETILDELQDKDIIQIQNNFIPRALIYLKEAFDREEKYNISTLEEQQRNYQEIEVLPNRRLKVRIDIPSHENQNVILLSR